MEIQKHTQEVQKIHSKRDTMVTQQVLEKKKKSMQQHYPPTYGNSKKKMKILTLHGA